MIGKEICFEIPGEPVSKARPRVTKYGAYTPEKTVNYENWVKICFKESKAEMLEGQIKAQLNCYFSIPKSFSKKKTNEAIQCILRPTKKPDIDNIVKIIFDSLNGLAYKDDSQIVDLAVRKYYSQTPRVEVYLSES